MGCSLGPLFAVLYISRLENKLYRYVGDIIAVFQKPSHTNWFKIRLQRGSALKYTHENFPNNRVYFLEISFPIQENGNCTTSVHVKPTDNSTYSNYNSYTLGSYKKALVKTLVHTAFKYSSD